MLQERLKKENAYQCLDHLHSLFTEVTDTLADTECTLCLHLLHHHVQGDEGASATHSCTAVYQQWWVLGGREEFADVTNEADDGHDVVRNSMIWPGCVVELSHCHWLSFLHKLNTMFKNLEFSQPYIEFTYMFY